jgi:hypothetical protein
MQDVSRSVPFHWHLLILPAGDSNQPREGLQSSSLPKETEANARSNSSFESSGQVKEEAKLT